MENTLLNLIPAAYLPEIHLSQYDVGRTLTFTLKDGASDYSVPSGASVKVKATKPSGFGFEVACTFNGGTVTLVTTDTMTPENGRFPAELSIVSGNTTIGTSNFIFNIERSPHPEGTINGDAETIIPELTLLVERIEAAAEDVDEKAELFLNLSAEAETLPAGSLATANYSDGVLTLGIPRGYDGDDTKADAIVKSASGEVASFSDGGNGLLCKSLNVSIVPKQSGSGDPSPSNVRPISGTNTVNVTRCGKNLIDEANCVIYPRYLREISSDNHTWAEADDSACISIKCKPNTQYTISISNPDRRFLRASWVDYDPATVQSGQAPQVYGFINRNPYADITITTGANAKYLIVQSGKALLTSRNSQIQIEEGSTATAYEPYQGTSYPISLGQTVYGGTLDVVSGKLTIEWKTVDLGILTWAYDSSYQFFYTSSLNNDIINVIDTTEHPILSDKFKISAKNVSLSDSGYADMSNYEIAYHKRSMQTATYLYAKDTSTTDPTTFKSSVLGSILAYKMETPTEIQLTPTQVNTLLGNNNIFADSGSVEVEYRADTTLVYNELLSLIASL